MSADFYLFNNTNHSIKIIWDEAAFVDAEGLSHRIVHKGIKYIDMEKPQPVSVVVRGGILSDIVVPTTYVSHSSAFGWRKDPFFSPVFTQSSHLIEQVLQDSKYNIGKVVQILLPLAIQGTVNEYIFLFKVNDVQITDKILGQMNLSSTQGYFVRARVKKGVNYNGFVYSDDNWLEGRAKSVSRNLQIIKMRRGGGVVRIPINTLTELQVKKQEDEEWSVVGWVDQDEAALRHLVGIQ